jgi:hypothetical protein
MASAAAHGYCIDPSISDLGRLGRFVMLFLHQHSAFQFLRFHYGARPENVPNLDIGVPKLDRSVVVL